MNLPPNHPFSRVQNLPAFMDEIARRDFAMFVRLAFPLVHGGAALDWNWHLDTMTCYLNEIDQGRNQRLLVNLPPRNLKSFMISVAWVAWMLGRDPRRNFVCISYSNELSAKLARDCLTIMQSALYRRLFPKTIISTKRSANYDFNTTRGGGRLATSVTGTLTGRGGDFIIIDDPIKPSDAYSETVRESVNDWYRTTLSSRLNDKRKGAIICVMQRLHQYDLCGLMLEDGGWQHLCLPAVASEDGSFPMTRKRVHTRKADDVLHPSREPRWALDKIQNEQGSHTFAAQYLQAPVPAKGNIIFKDWLVHMKEEFPSHGEIVQSWDTGVKDGEKNDYSACITARLAGKHVYILDVFRKRLAFPDLLRTATAHALEYKAQTLLVEDAASGNQLITMMREAKVTGVPLPLARKVEQDKTSRVHGMSPIIEQGRLVLPTSAPWLADFEAELTAFPSVRHDDQVDALSQLINWMVINRQHSKPTLAGPIHVEEGDSYRRYGDSSYLDPWI